MLSTVEVDTAIVASWSAEMSLFHIVLIKEICHNVFQTTRLTNSNGSTKDSYSAGVRTPVQLAAGPLWAGSACQKPGCAHQIRNHSAHICLARCRLPKFTTFCTICRAPVCQNKGQRTCPSQAPHRRNHCRRNIPTILARTAARAWHWHRSSPPTAHRSA